MLVESFGYDESLYQDYAVAHPDPSADGGLRFVPYTGARLPNLDYVVSFTVPTRKGLTADGLILWGKDENFYEWSSADIVFANVGATWRPTNQLRLEGRYQLQSFQRRTDGSYVGIRRIPRVKVEYQVTRAIFVRVVAEQNAQLRRHAARRLPHQPARSTSATPPGCIVRRARQEANRLRVDWLFSYQPTPGTVVFAGYGTSLEEPDRFGDVRRRLIARQRRVLRQDQLSFPLVVVGRAATSPTLDRRRSITRRGDCGRAGPRSSTSGLRTRRWRLFRAASGAELRPT